MARTAAPLDVRAAILEAASELLCSQGYRQMTMDEIARQARIGKATIYGYFQGKEEVALEVLDRQAARMREHLSRIAMGPGTPEERLRQILLERAVFLYNRARQHRMSIDDTLAALRPLVMARREQYHEADSRLLAAVVEEGQRHRVFAARGLWADPVTTASTLVAATGGLMPYSLSPRELDNREEFLNKAERVIELLLQGVLSR